MKADPTKTHEARKWNHARPFIAARFDPQGRFIFAGAEENAVQRMEFGSNAKTELKGHDTWVRAIGFSLDGATTLAGQADRERLEEMLRNMAGVVGGAHEQGSGGRPAVEP